MSTKDWIKDHLALVIILAAVVVSIVIIILIYFIRRRNFNGYQKLEMDLNEYLSSQRPEDQKKVEQDRSEMDARFFLRSLSIYEFDRALPGIGSRPEKHYFLVKNNAERKRDQRDQMLMIFPKADDCVFPFTDGTRQIVIGLLSRIRHPFVFPTTYSDVLSQNDHVYLMQPFRNQGSIKDLIYQSDPQDAYAKKYKIAGKPLSERAIGVYGRQILEGLSYFEKVGYPYGQLSSSNVIVDAGICRLAGYENSLFGLAHPLTESLFANLLRKYRKANKNRKLLNVLQFGHVMFEMVTGYTLDTEIPNFKLSRASKSISEVLDFIFGKQIIPGRILSDDPDAPENCPFPTVQELMSHPFFVEAALNLKKADLVHELTQRFDPSMEELLTSIKNQKKLTSSNDAKKRKSKRPTSMVGAVEPITTSSASASANRTASVSQSTSTAPPTPLKTPASASPLASPPPPPPTAPAVVAPPPPPPAAAAAPRPPSSGGRGALLDSITGFSGGLKKVKTNDRSKPSF